MKELAQIPDFDPAHAAGAYIASPTCDAKAATRHVKSAAFVHARFRSYPRAESDSLANAALEKE
jgi:hypothetical protein